MSKCKAVRDKAILSEFVLEGRFLGYAPHDRGKLKYIRLANNTEHLVKLAKDLRSLPLIPGEWLQLEGTRQVNATTGQIKLKALTIARPFAIESAAPLPNATQKPQTILVCQKSDCCKLGAKAIASALDRAIEDQGLSGQVIVKATGCMKRCKAGPNIVMSDKTRYTKISPQAIPSIVERHYLDQRNSGNAIAMPTMPSPALNANTIPTGICTDSNTKNLRATGVAF